MRVPDDPSLPISHAGLGSLNSKILIMPRDLLYTDVKDNKIVDDLEKARETLEANGCKVLRWRGKGQDCYVRDPFGVIFNLWEE